MRTLSTTLLLALALTLSLTAGNTIAADKLKVVYHVADEDKVSFALNNIQNHIDGVGGPDDIEIRSGLPRPGGQALRRHRGGGQGTHECCQAAGARREL